MDNRVVITELEKGYNEKLIFSLSEFRGKKYADIRVFYEDDEGEWKPTKKGITIAPDRFEEFEEAIGQLRQRMVEDGLVAALED